MNGSGASQKTFPGDSDHVRNLSLYFMHNVSMENSAKISGPQVAQFEEKFP